MTWPVVVLFVHIIAACIWIGGQITLVAILPVLRVQPEMIRATGRRFQILAWSAYCVLIVTGIGNVLILGFTWSSLTSTRDGHVLLGKIGLVMLSGVTAALHAFVLAPRQQGMSTRAFSISAAILGSSSLLTALGAALFGVVIAQGTA